MKHLLITLLLSVVSVSSMHGQAVYNEVLRLSRKAAADTSLSLEARKMAQFKVDALEYMVEKTRQLMPDSAVTILDYQAFALFDYVNLFTQQLGKTKKKKDRQQVLDLFQTASLQNARFFDTDRDFIMAYVRSQDHITRFSLDTDWVLALNEVRERLWGKP